MHERKSKRLPLFRNSPTEGMHPCINHLTYSFRKIHSLDPITWPLGEWTKRLVAAARLRCELLEDDERKGCTRKKKRCQEVNQRALQEALAECVQRQGESRLLSLPILEGSLNTRVPPHPRSQVPRVGKERWRNKLPGARSKWLQQHRKN